MVRDLRTDTMGLRAGTQLELLDKFLRTAGDVGDLWWPGMSLFVGVASADSYEGIGNLLNSDESGQVAS